MKIQNVLIVGGGTSGWFTAASLLKLCPHINVSLIESEDYPVIGVGESTLGQINDFFHLLGLNDDEWMRETGSTYKVNIRFNDFYKEGETWDYPFGTSHERMYEMQHGWMSWFALNYHKPEKFHRGTFATTFNSVGHFAKYNKLTWQDRVWNPQSDSAYHMDAIRMGQWFKKNEIKQFMANRSFQKWIDREEWSKVTMAIYKEVKENKRKLDDENFKLLLFAENQKTGRSKYNGILDEIGRAHV